MKKMRKLIPAFAMLMVAAIMMTTASFAWFTMNESVDVTNMTVQAQAGGSMLIGTAPLTATSTGTNADFALQGTMKIKPTSYSATSKAWQIPADTKDVDVITGKNEGGWTSDGAHVATTKDNAGNMTVGTYVQYVVYVAVAGDTVTKNIKVDLSTASALQIANAYAVAFYVGETFDADEPALVLHVKDGATITGEATATIKTGHLYAAPTAIPSVVGATDAENGVGIKITMRVYVDGNLETGSTYTPQVNKYVSAKDTAYSSTKTYFVANTDAQGNVTYTPAAVENVYTEGANITADWFVIDGVENGTPEMIYYANNSTAPDAPSGLNVLFTLDDYGASSN
jgi:hypothetical protein